MQTCLNVAAKWHRNLLEIVVLVLTRYRMSKFRYAVIDIETLRRRKNWHQIAKEHSIGRHY